MFIATISIQAHDEYFCAGHVCYNSAHTSIQAYLGPLSEHSLVSDQAATHRQNKTPNLMRIHYNIVNIINIKR